GGTRSSTEAVHSTCVSPNLARQEPSAYFATPGSRMIGRIASGSRPEGRMLFSAIAQLELLSADHIVRGSQAVQCHLPGEVQGSVLSSSAGQTCSRPRARCGLPRDEPGRPRPCGAIG